MRIGWVVDHPKRDLAGSVFAAYQLTSRGASVKARKSREPFVLLSSALRGTRPNPSAGQIVKGAASLVRGSAATEKLRTSINPARRNKRDPSAFTATRAQCVKTRVPLAGILVEPRPARA